MAPPAWVRAPLRRPGARPPRLAARQLAAARHARRSAKALRDRCRGRARRPRCRDLPQPGVGSRGRQPRQGQMGGQKGGQRGRRARGNDAPRQRCTTTTCPQPLRTPEWVAWSSDRAGNCLARRGRPPSKYVHAPPRAYRQRGVYSIYVKYSIRQPCYTEFFTSRRAPVRKSYAVFFFSSRYSPFRQGALF